MRFAFISDLPRFEDIVRYVRGVEQTRECKRNQGESVRQQAFAESQPADEKLHLAELAAGDSGSG